MEGDAGGAFAVGSGQSYVRGLGGSDAWGCGAGGDRNRECAAEIGEEAFGCRESV